MGVVGAAKTNFDSGTIPDNVCRESTRKIVLTVSTPPSKCRSASTASCALAFTGRAIYSVVIRPAAESCLNSSRPETSCALLGPHFFQNAFRLFLGQVAQQVGRSIRLHFFDDLRRAIGIERLENRLLHLGLDFFQRTGRHFFVQRLEDRFALVRGQIFHDICNIGRMQLGQPVMGNF